MYCQTCNAPLEFHAQFCNKCGSAVQAPPVAPQPPHPPYYSQPAQPVDPGWNIFAVLGFVFTFIPVASFVNIVFCIIGLVQIKKTGQRGKGLAIAGIVLGLAGYLLMLLAVLAFLPLMSEYGAQFLTEDWVADQFGYTWFQSTAAAILGSV